MENMQKCRTCLASGTSKEITTALYQTINGSTSTTYRDVLLQVVPQMETTVNFSDYICPTCRKFLKMVVRFIEQCLQVEEQLVEAMEEDEDEDAQMEALVLEESAPEEEGEVPQTEGEEDQAAAGAEDRGEKEVLENIEIIIQDDEGWADQDLLDEDEGAIRKIDDHAYIKSEIEEGEVFMDEDAGNYKLYIGDGSEEAEEEAEGEVHPDDPPEVHVKVEMEEEEEEEEDLMGESSQSEQVMCEVCGKGFRNSVILKKHLSTHEDKRVQCPRCPKVFKSEIYLNRHKNLVHEPDELGVRFMCSECNKLFKNKGALNAHFKLKHLKLEPYKCEICDETFGRADYLKKHLAQHIKFSPESKPNKMKTKVPGKFIRFKNTDDPIPCKICGKYYNGIHKLKVHLQTHVVVKRYACEYCELTYKRWPSLKRHERTHLEADGTFHRCNVCWKRLPTKDDLTVHMAQHGNPRYRCHICDEQFHRKYLFDNHFLLQHATPEDLEISKKEVIYDTLLELANQSS